MSRRIGVGDRVRDPATRAAGVVLSRTEGMVRVAFDGQLPREVPVDQLERVQ